MNTNEREKESGRESELESWIQHCTITSIEVDDDENKF